MLKTTVDNDQSQSRPDEIQSTSSHKTLQETYCLHANRAQTDKYIVNR